MPGASLRYKTFQKVVPSQSNVVINYSRVYPPLFYNPLKINTKSKSPLKPFKTLYFWWLYKVIIPSRVDSSLFPNHLIINTKSKYPLKPFKTSYFSWPYRVIILSRVDLFKPHTRLIINTIYICTSKPFTTLYLCGVIKSSRLYDMCAYPATQICSFSE